MDLLKNKYKFIVTALFFFFGVCVCVRVVSHGRLYPSLLSSPLPALFVFALLRGVGTGVQAALHHARGCALHKAL